MSHHDQLTLLGFASGIAANNADCALGPWYLYYHPNLFNELTISTHWQPMIHTTSSEYGLNVLPLLVQKLDELSRAVLLLAGKKQSFCVVGGDHSCGIATWSAVAHANRHEGDIGLIWIDAHMDSHTFETSITKNIHGMPVAHLLGHGEKTLHQLLDNRPTLKPEHLCLIGVRSYQTAEANLLSRLGVRVYFMEEVQTRGIDDVLAEACAKVCQSTCGFGISIDLDAIDPHDAPGVGCRELGGIEGAALIRALKAVVPHQPILGLEIAEFNPLLDEGEKTAKLVVDLIAAVFDVPSPLVRRDQIVQAD